MNHRELEKMTDQQLIELVKSENVKQAYDVLVLRYYQDAVRFCMKMVRDEQTALDMVQDSFADIYVQKERLSSACVFKTYLFAVVKHKSLDELRRRGRHITEELETAEMQGKSPPTPEDVCMKKEEHEELVHWIEELPEDYRRVLYFFCVEGMTYQEIGAVMEKNIPQIKILLYRARKKLQRRRRENR